MTSTQSVIGILVGFGLTLFYFFIRKEAKTTTENIQLKEDIKTQNEEAKRIVNVQRKQAEIASKPTPDRDTIHEWMHGLSNRDKS